MLSIVGVRRRSGLEEEPMLSDLRASDVAVSWNLSFEGEWFVDPLFVSTP